MPIPTKEPSIPNKRGGINPKRVPIRMITKEPGIPISEDTSIIFPTVSSLSGMAMPTLSMYVNWAKPEASNSPKPTTAKRVTNDSKTFISV